MKGKMDGTSVWWRILIAQKQQVHHLVQKKLVKLESIVWEEQVS